MTATVISLAMQKGGTGKTVSAVNLAYVLAGMGRRVLLVDLDSQGNATVASGIAPQSLLSPQGNRTVWACLKGRFIEMRDGAPEVRDVLVRREWNGAGYDLLPSTLDLSEAEQVLPTAMGREKLLGYLLESVQEEYDLVLLDCLPSLGNLTVAALTASAYVLIPLEAQHLALFGMTLLLQTIAQIVRLRVNPRLRVLGLFFNKVDPRTNQSREVMAEAVRAYGPYGWPLCTTIPANTTISDATMAGMPVGAYRANSPGAVAFRQLGEEVLERLAAQSGGDHAG
jgi:chromosome partitioning protein